MIEKADSLHSTVIPKLNISRTIPFVAVINQDSTGLSHYRQNRRLRSLLRLTSPLVPFWEFLKIFLQKPVTRLRVTAFVCVARM